MGMLMTEAMPTITKVPTMALPKPPPISKPAGGSSVKRLRLSREPPRTRSIHRTEMSGMPAMTAASHTPIVSERFVSARRSNGERSRLRDRRRRARRRHCLDVAHVRRSRPGRHGHDRLADRVDDQRDGEQDQGRVHQDLHFARAGFGEVEREEGGQGIGGREEREADLVRVSDQHRQRHGLTEGASEAQHERAEDPAEAAGSMTRRMASQRVVPMP